MPDTVSVIIPTFNRGHVLEEAVDSVLAQQHRNVQVIVVDDGSTDGTEGLMKGRFDNDARILYRYQKNAGASRARNAALDVATGEFIAFLDSDDTWKPWHLSLLLAALDRCPEAGLIWTNAEAVDPTGAVTSSAALPMLLSAYHHFSLDDLFSTSSPLSELGVDIPERYRDHRLYVGDVFSPMLMGNLVLTSSALMRRERLQQVGRFDERLVVGEDYEFFLRACRAGPVAFADIADTRYRVGTPDKLGRPAMARSMALGYLQVLEATLARDADRITLTPSMLATARSHANRWVGELELLDGSRRSARAHLASALRIDPRQPSVLVALMLTFMPSAIFQRMVRWRRRVKGRLRPAPTRSTPPIDE